MPANSVLNFDSHVREKIISVNGENYKLHKLSAFDGSVFIKFITQKILPGLGNLSSLVDKIMVPPSGKHKKGESEQVTMSDVNALIDCIVPIINDISDDDMRKIMTKCLQNIQKEMPAGYVDILQKDSTFFCIPELEYDTTSCLVLCFYEIKFEVEGFFGEGGLHLPPNLRGIFQQKP